MSNSAISSIDPEDILSAKNFFELIDRQLTLAVLGQERAVMAWKLGLLTGESVLFVGPPGTAKSHLCRVGAALIGGTAKVTQGTPDAMASDLTGRWELVRRTGEWVFREGSLFANCVLLDELNRLPPKVQSALLEAMQFGEVTVEGETRVLPKPWIVMGSMNPEGHDAGTYPIPRPAKDRWGLGAVVTRPTKEQEVLIARGNYLEAKDMKAIANGLQRVMSLQELVNNLVPTVPMDIADLAVRIVLKTTDTDVFSIEASPRASKVIVRAAVALALMHGQAQVTFNDVMTVAPFALEHKVRLADNFAMNNPGRTVSSVLQDILNREA